MAAPALRRELGLAGAVLVGLGSILGTGVFVSLGLAAGATGAGVVAAVALAAAVATCNGLSSAQLAANHPTSGGAYEYGYRYLHPWAGFAAGWLFLCAKSASAAAAALGFAGYLRTLAAPVVDVPAVWLAEAAVLALTLVVLAGLKRGNRLNLAILLVTLAGLATFIGSGLGPALAQGPAHFTTDWMPRGWGGFGEAVALCFVAFAGFARITVLGEEVREPRRAIPRAIGITLALAAVVYLAVAAVAVGAAGAERYAAAARGQAAPLGALAREWAPAATPVVSVAAMTAMLGVLLNLIAGLSRMLLAMGRRGDLPAGLARLNAVQTTPPVAVLATGGIIAILVGLGSVRFAWSFSAFTVLLYYALTNLAALRLPRAARIYPPIIAWSGLVACAGLACCVEPRAWLAGLLVLAAGAVWRLAWRRVTSAAAASPASPRH